MSLYGLYDYTFRLIIIGDCAVGKTAFTQRIANKMYTNVYDTTIGVDYGTAIINVKDAIIKCQLWDTAGQETFAPLVASYYKDIAGVMLFFDVGRRSSFHRVKFWLNELKTHRNSEIIIPKILIGNKIDICNRKVSTKEARNFANNHGLLYEEISVKNNINLINSLSVLCNKIYETKDTNPGVRQLSPDLKQQESTELDKSRYNYECCIIT